MSSGALRLKVKRWLREMEIFCIYLSWILWFQCEFIFRYFCFFLAYSSALKWYNLWCRFWNFLFDLFELIFSNKIIFNERNGLETGDHKINLRVFCLSLHRRAYDDVVSYFANFGKTYWRISVGSRLSCVYNLVVYYLTDFMSY